MQDFVIAPAGARPLWVTPNCLLIPPRVWCVYGEADFDDDSA